LQLNGFGDIAIFLFSRWPPSAILDFEILKHLVIHEVGRSNLHRRAKFYQSRSSDFRDINFNVFFSKLWLNAILDFLKFDFLNSICGSEGQYASDCKIS